MAAPPPLMPGIGRVTWETQRESLGDYDPAHTLASHGRGNGCRCHPCANWAKRNCGQVPTTSQQSGICAEPRYLVTLWRESTEIRKSAVPLFWTPCWFSMVPASLPITSRYHEGVLIIDKEWALVPATPNAEH